MDNEEWNEVDTTTSEEEKNKVEYEVEGEIEQEEKAIPLVQAKEEEEPKVDTPPELEGVETKGAQQIRRQRNELDCAQLFTGYRLYNAEAFANSNIWQSVSPTPKGV